MLESAGFEVDLWPGQAVTVDFYRKLPLYGYKLIVLRAHSGILLAAGGSKFVPTKTSYLFTGETYTPSRYVYEQLTDKLVNAMMTDTYPLVFAINSQFVADESQGTFNNTVILSMGCESSYIDDMAAAFISKGASAYVGWSTAVTLDYVDNATTNLLNNLCGKHMTIEQSIASTMAETGHDPYFNSYLKCYPVDKGNQTIEALVR
jgi:hypothetical protein